MHDLLLPLRGHLLEPGARGPTRQALQAREGLDNVFSGGADGLRNFGKLLHERVVARVSVCEVHAVDDPQDHGGEGAVNAKTQNVSY